MLGKITGIGLVSLTQFLIWIFIAGFGYLLFMERFGEQLSLFSNAQIQDTIKAQGIDVAQAMEWNSIINTFASVEFGMFIPVFLFYFVFGYLFYSSIFAAVGSLADSETDTQQFIFPLTLPILLCFILMQFFVENPHHLLTTFFSFLPFTSPVTIMILLPYGISFSQLLISMLTLILSFLASTYCAGRIFRNGILYNGKPGWKQIKEWLRM
jgi:ABC-2 type transport system permease protein